MSMSNCEMGEGTQMQQMTAWIHNLPAMTELDVGDEKQGNEGVACIYMCA